MASEQINYRMVDYEAAKELLVQNLFDTKPSETKKGEPIDAIYFVSDGEPIVVGAMNRQGLFLIRGDVLGEYHRTITESLLPAGCIEEIVQEEDAPTQDDSE